MTQCCDGAKINTFWHSHLVDIDCALGSKFDHHLAPEWDDQLVESHAVPSCLNSFLSIPCSIEAVHQLRILPHPAAMLAVARCMG